jgi:hypothetical protein
MVPAFRHSDSQNHVPRHQVDAVIAGNFNQNGVLIAHVERRLFERRIRQLPLPGLHHDHRLAGLEVHVLPAWARLQITHK